MSRIITVTLNPALDLSTETALVTPATKLRCAVPRADPGGGGVNVSRAIFKLGGESLCAVAAGGAAGATLLGLLEVEGLQARDLGLELTTRESLSVIEQASGAQYRFVMPGPQWEARHVAQALAKIEGWCAPGDLLVPSGSLPPGVPADVFSDLNARLMVRGVRMVLDTSGAALVAAASKRGLFALRMDDTEADALAGHALSDVGATASFAAGLVEGGVAEIVQIARGAEGTVMATAQGCWHCAPPVVEVVSAVGAGDSHVGGFVLGLARGLSPLSACVQGVAAAASAVGTPGTALCEREAVERLVGDVVVREVVAG
jgi:6-phosphofructokinase 2